MKTKIRLLDLVMSISNTIDLISTQVSDHHKRVAYIAYQIGKEMNLGEEELTEIVIAGAMHDIGSLSLNERLDINQFEVKMPYLHAKTGCILLKKFVPFSKIADIVHYHHITCSDAKKLADLGYEIPIGSLILHLADRIEILIDKNSNVLNQVDFIVDKINENRDILFKTEAVDAFNALSKKEFFWLDIVSPRIEKIFFGKIKFPEAEYNLDQLLDLAKLFSQIIDFRSRFTATHSSGVAASAEQLAKLAGFTEEKLKMVRIAGYFHDIGKLAIPNELLEKAGKLTGEEYNIIKSHTYYTKRILDNINGFQTISEWASFHHERLDGNGYPFHYTADNISLGSRILAVADVFTAISEDRPYRKGMDKETAIMVLNDMVDQSALDGEIVELLISFYESVNSIRIKAQKTAANEYENFKNHLLIPLV